MSYSWLALGERGRGLSGTIVIGRVKDFCDNFFEVGKKDNLFNAERPRLYRGYIAGHWTFLGGLV